MRQVLPVNMAVRYIGHRPGLVPCRCQMVIGTQGTIKAVYPGHGGTLGHGEACHDLYSVTFEHYGPHMCCEHDIEPCD